MVFAPIQRAKPLYFEWQAKRAGRETTRERAAEETDSCPFFPAPCFRVLLRVPLAHHCSQYSLNERPVPGVQIVERGRKLDEEKKGETREGEASVSPLFSPCTSTSLPAI